MIHKYKLDDAYILLDVNSGGVFKIDEITYDILDHYPNPEKDAAIKLLKEKYQEIDILQTIEEIDYLISHHELFSPPTSMTTDFKLNTSIKAMCLHVSHDCNIRCKYCFASQGNFQGDRLLMDEVTGKKAIDFLIANSVDRKNL